MKPTEKLSDLGYLQIGKESSVGVAVVPTVAVPLYSETLFTKPMYELDNQIMGQPFGVYNIFQGQREHTGDITIMAEPKTLPHFLQMFINKISSTNNAGVYTHLFQLGAAEASYTIEFLKGDVTHRYFGCEIESISPEWKSESVMSLKLNVSALGSVTVIPLTSASSTTITPTTDYDPKPARGLVVGDVLTLVHINGGTQDTTEQVTILSIASDYSTITTSSSISGTYSAGDYFYITKRSITPVVDTPFNWARTEFRFGDTASEALSATATPLEKGSKFDITNPFNDKTGEKRSGSFDPVSFARKPGDAKLTVKKFFNDGKELNDFVKKNKKACVIRMFGSLVSGSTFNEFRITLNNTKIVESPDPLTAGQIIYLNQTLQAQYDTTDLQAFDINVINGISSY